MARNDHEDKLATIVSLRERLRELRPDAPGVIGWGPRWTPDELAAFETEHGHGLPAGYRGFLETIGDGGPAPGRGLMALRDQAADELARLRRPFVLAKGWVTPTIRDQLEAEGLGRKYQKYLYELPEGAEADDGTLSIGVTDDHRGLLLVVNGKGAGKIWYDNRGNDFEEVLPTRQSFLDMIVDYFQARVAEAETDARFRTLVDGGDLAALRAAFGDELTRLFRDVFKAREPISPALARMIAEHAADDYGSAAQALALGGCWLELEERCLRDWAAFEAGALEPSFRAEATVQAHLAVAQVALGRPGPVHAYGRIGGYWHRSTSLVPLVVSRWDDDDQVSAVFDRLRHDVALVFLAHFPTAALAGRLPWVERQGRRWLDGLVERDPTLDRVSMSGPVSDVLERLVELLDAGTSGELEAALDTWFWLAGCTTSEKSFAKILAAAGDRFSPTHPSRDQALAALAERSPRR